MNFLSDLEGLYRNIFSPVLDIAILAFIIYKCYEFLAETQAVQLLKGAGLLAIIYGIAYVLKLNTLFWILKALTPGFVIAIAIVLQPELRKIIIRLGLTEIFRPSNKPRTGQIDAVVTAAEILSKQEKPRGMLIVFPRKSNINDIIATGTRINGEISSTLIVTIFQFDGPLHDGALIIQNGKIAAAGCFLPLSEQQNIRKSFGTRHRAALGVTEQSDSVVLIVSEETGAISLAFDSHIYYDLEPEEIQQKLRSLLEKTALEKATAGAKEIQDEEGNGENQDELQNELQSEIQGEGSGAAESRNFKKGDGDE